MEKIVDYFSKFDAILVFSILSFLSCVFFLFVILDLHDKLTNLYNKLSINFDFNIKKKDLESLKHNINILEDDLKKVETMYFSKLSEYHSLCDYIEIEKRISKNKSKGGKK